MKYIFIIIFKQMVYDMKNKYITIKMKILNSPLDSSLFKII